MQKLLEYLNRLPTEERDAFAARCETTMGYLRKAISVGQKIGLEICIRIERESDGAVQCEHIRPDVDWWIVRSRKPPQGFEGCAQEAINKVAPQAQEVAHG